MRTGIMIVAVFFCFVTNSLFAQIKKNDPENIVVTYNNDGTKTISYKDGLSHDPDSVNQVVFSEVNEGYKLKKDTAFILSHITGSWFFNSAVRTNGKDPHMSAPLVYEFNTNGRFTQIAKNDTITGKWSLSGPAKIRLEFDRPYVLVKDRSILKYLDSATLRKITFSNVELTLHALNDTEMAVLSAVIAGNNQANGDIYYRIVFINFTRKKD